MFIHLFLLTLIRLLESKLRRLLIKGLLRFALLTITILAKLRWKRLM